MALSSSHTPTALILTRQAVAATGCTSEQALRGGYVVREASSSKPDLIIVATGSEVGLAMQSGEALEAKGVATRVVSLPSWLTFEQQGEDYQRSVLPEEVPTLSIEAGSTFGWAKYADAHVGIDHFGASAPAEILFREFGFTVDNVVAVADRLLGSHA